MITQSQNDALTAMVQFGFDVLITSITKTDIMFAVNTSRPDWSKAKIADMCAGVNAAYTIYTDMDRVFGYLYADNTPE